MKSILYIGNKLNSNRTNLSSIDVLGPLLESEGYLLYYASAKGNRLLRLLDMLWSCIKYRRSIDTVLIDTYSTLNFYYAFFVSQLCRLLNMKYITNLNGGNLSMRLQRNPRLSRMIFDNAHKKVAPSLYLKQSFEQLGYLNIDYIQNTIDLTKYPFKERNLTTVKLLWVRSFSKIYNPLLAVKLLKALQDEDIEASLCMVGPDNDGTLRKVKAYLQKHNLKATLTGKLTKQEWVDLSKHYNIFINTTNFDNMPVSVIEAMALGLPVISTNVGGMPQLIKHNHDGLLVQPNNVDAFVKAINKIIKTPGLAKTMTINARSKVEQFDWKIVKQLWIKLLS